MAQKINFPVQIEDLRVKYKLTKTVLNKFLNSLESHDDLDWYIEQINLKYGTPTITIGSAEDCKINGIEPSLIVVDEIETCDFQSTASDIEEMTNKIVEAGLGSKLIGYHPITGKEVYVK